MDSTIINTAITSIASLATCFIGLRAGKRNSEFSSVKKIKEKQLRALLGPMVQCLIFSNASIDTTLSQLRKIIADCFTLVPPAILYEFNKVAALESPTSADLKDLRDSVNSFFNWTRKSLGYPYDKSAIKRKWIPTYERNIIIGTFITMISLLLWGGSVMVTLTLLLGGATNLAPDIEQICVVVASIGTFAVLIPLTQRKSH